MDKSSESNEHISIFGFTIVYAVFVLHEYNLSIRLNESVNLTVDFICIRSNQADNLICESDCRLFVMCYCEQKSGTSLFCQFLKIRCSSSFIVILPFIIVIEI
jgi:hypothetical protein